MKTVWATTLATILAGLAAQVTAAPANRVSPSGIPVIPKSGICDISSTTTTGDYLRTSGSYTPDGALSVNQLSVTTSATNAAGTRCYILYLPNKAINTSAPLVVLLHGGNSHYVGSLQPPGNLLLGENGNAQSVWVTTADSFLTDSSGNPQSVADHYGVVVAVPNGMDDANSTNGGPNSTQTPTSSNLTVGQHWNDCSGFNPGYANTTTATYNSQLKLWASGSIFYAQKSTYSPVDDVLFIKTMITDITSKALAANITIDPTRIYAVGASNGSNMAMRLAREDYTQFAAVAASLGGDGAQATISYDSKGNPIYTYSGSADTRGANDPTACTDEPQTVTVPIMLIKGVPAPGNYKVGGTLAYSGSGDSYITFEGGCSGTAYGCWLPYDSTTAFTPASGLWGYHYTGTTSAPTTLQNWLYRNKLATSGGTLLTGISNNIVGLSNGYTDYNSTDGSVLASLYDSYVGGTYGTSGLTGNMGTCSDFYNPAVGASKGNELKYCVVYRNGHIDPSIAITAGAYESVFGNENQDFESATEEWRFLSPHTLVGGVHN